MRLTVLLTPEQFGELVAYCEREGHKKSTLVARIIRDFLRERARKPIAPAPEGDE